MLRGDFAELFLLRCALFLLMTHSDRQARAISAAVGGGGGHGDRARTSN